MALRSAAREGTRHAGRPFLAAATTTAVRHCECLLTNQCRHSSPRVPLDRCPHSVTAVRVSSGERQDWAEARPRGRRDAHLRLPRQDLARLPAVGLGAHAAPLAQPLVPLQGATTTPPSPERARRRATDRVRSPTSSSDPPPPPLVELVARRVVVARRTSRRRSSSRRRAEGSAPRGASAVPHIRRRSSRSLPVSRRASTSHESEPSSLTTAAIDPRARRSPRFVVVFGRRASPFRAVVVVVVVVAREDYAPRAFLRIRKCFGVSASDYAEVRPLRPRARGSAWFVRRSSRGRERDGRARHVEGAASRVTTEMRSRTDGVTRRRRRSIASRGLRPRRGER